MNKKIVSPLGRVLFVCAMLGLWGCDDTTETVYVDFSLSRYSVAFPVEGGTASVTVSTEEDWGAVTSASWLTLEQDGDVLTITAETNDQSTEIRQTEVNVTTASSKTAAVQIRQEPASTPVLTVNAGAEPSPIDSEGGVFTISVQSDREWSAAFAEAVSNWELDINAETGLVNVIASANSGGIITGTVVVTAGSGAVTTTEEVQVTQISRDDNPYFKFLGDWDIYSSDCYYGLQWVGEGVNCMMGFAEYDYANAFMSFVHWDGDPELETDDLSYDAKTGKVTMPLGSVAGSFVSWYETYYMYFVALNAGMTNYSTTYYLEFTLSEDGSEISVSGLDDSYPVLGFVAYNENSTTFSGFSDIPYCKIPISLTKASTKAGTAVKAIGNVTFGPVGELPEGVPARLPKMTGEIHNML